jgi:hypothetical protein
VQAWQAGRRAGGQAWQAWQGPRPVWDKDHLHPQIDDSWVERADSASWPLHMLVLAGPALSCTVLYCIGLVCCVALRCVALPCPARQEAEPERRAEPGRINQCHSRCQRNRNNRETDWAARDEARQERRAQSRAHARNVTSTWGLGARLWRRPITRASRSVVCRAALILVARRSPPAARSSLMAHGMARLVAR